MQKSKAKNMSLNKKAAMFGLDARIALAIFGALSVITGAALYNAIKDAKALALLSEMNEIGKAWESYYIDTGVNLPQKSTIAVNSGFYVLKSAELVENSTGTLNWNGPYINKDISGISLLFNSSGGGIRFLTLTSDSVWGDSAFWYDVPEAMCPLGEKCYVWVSIYGFVKDDPIVKSLDKIIDNSDGGDAGAFRWYYDSSTGWETRIYYKYAPVKNPND